MRSRQPAARRFIALTAALVGGASLVACDDSAEASRSLQEAQATLAALHAGSAMPSLEFVESTNNDIRRTLAPALADDAARGAAKLIEGQTHIGDAEAALKKAKIHEDASGAMLAEARTLAGRLYAWRHARAEASGSFSPDTNVSDIDGAIRTAQSDRAELVDQREGVQTRLSRLEEAASEADAQVQRLRQREVLARDEALALDGGERVAALQEAYDVQRAADSEVARAQDLRAQAAQLRPTLDELDRRIAGGEGLVELLRASRESLQERGARQARVAQVDREQANIAADRLENLLNELHAYRSDELDPVYTAAAAAYSKAQSSLRAASGDGANGLWAATAHHGSASLAMLRENSLTRYAGGLEALAAMEPRLPFAGDLQARAKEARDAAAGLASDAADAYAQAASAYSRAARGPNADALRALAERLEATSTGGGAEDGADPADG